MNWDEINTKWSGMARRMLGDFPVAYDPPPNDPLPPSDPIEIPPGEFPPQPVPNPVPGGGLRLRFSQPIQYTTAVCW